MAEEKDEKKDFVVKDRRIFAGVKILRSLRLLSPAKYAGVNPVLGRTDRGNDNKIWVF